MLFRSDDPSHGGFTTTGSGSGDFSVPGDASVHFAVGTPFISRTSFVFTLSIAICEAFADADIAIGAAAVADYTPKTVSDHKLKKATEHLDAIELVETKDILRRLCETKGEGGRTRIVCGFAAETNDLIEHAQEKLIRKNCDLIVANDVSRSDSTFGSDTNHVTLLTLAGPIEMATMPKDEVAARILAYLSGMVEAVRQ